MTLELDARDLVVAATFLKRGEIVAFPTETVYGLGASIFNREAIAKIYAVKKRPQDNPLIAHIAFLHEIEKIAREVPQEAYLLAEHFFPGPLSIVLKKHSHVPEIVSAGGDTIAYRMPAHKMARKLIELVGEPLVAPSANLSGKPSPTTCAHVWQDFEGVIPAIIDGGPCTIGIESTVLSLVDPASPIIYRPGNIPKEALEKVLGRKIEVASPLAEKPLSPGMKYRHYAPKAKVYLFQTKEQLQAHISSTARTRKIATPTESTIYNILRTADQEGYEEICLLCDSAVQSQAGLMNRLLLASSQKV